MKRVVILLLICLSNGWLFANHWTPNESEYENNMTLTGVIQINGEEQHSTTLEVGVFCEGECRGSGYAVYFFPTQRYVIQLLIFGENGNPLTFKLYDSSLGQEIDMASPDPVTFNANGYGSLSDPYVLNFTGSVDENYVITVNTYPEDGGIVVGAGSYHEGQTCTLVAMPNAGYAFSNWTENGIVVSANPTYTFSVTCNHAVIANFTVVGNETHWVPNDSDYENNMTLTGIIQINGVEQHSSTLEVGVFCGEECRSSGLTTCFPPTQRYLVQLLVFGEEGDQLTFKLYDHNIGQELNLISPDAVTFVPNGYGALGNPYVLNFTGTTTETYTLDIIGSLNAGGYYLIAFPVDDINPIDIPGMTSGNYDLYYFDESQNGAEWRNYKTNTFKLHSGKGYLYAHSTDITLTFTGTPYNSDGQVSLAYTEGDHPGWNLIGNPFVCNAKLVNANNEPLPYYRMNATGNAIEVVAPGTPIAPMEGIFYKASENGVVYFIRAD